MTRVNITQEGTKRERSSRTAHRELEKRKTRSAALLMSRDARYNTNDRDDRQHVKITDMRYVMAARVAAEGERRRLLGVGGVRCLILP